MNALPEGMKSNAPRVLIAASGTGGHLFPALHIARALKEVSPDSVIEFIGTGRPLEKKLIDGAGYVRHEVRTVGLKNRGVRGLLEFIGGLPAAVASMWRLFNTFRPDVVIGAGGYATFFPVTLAFMRRIPTWIHEAELRPGMANLVLALYATKVSTAFAQAKIPTRSRVVFTGHPVRKEILDLAKEEQVPHDPKKILIWGGSQGAQGIDKGMLNLLDFVKARSLEIYHQCRAENVEELSRAYASKDINARVVSFIDDVVGAFRWADIIVSRSGAGSVMELGVLNKPVIFVPYPHAQGDHQTANAKTLTEQGKGFLVPEGEGFSERLKVDLERLLDRDFYVEMQKRELTGRSVDAARKIAEGSLQLIKGKGDK